MGHDATRAGTAGRPSPYQNQMLKSERAPVDECRMEMAFAGVFGAVIGSFINVIADRLPSRRSLIRPASHCESCSAPIRPYDNVPVLSWLLLRGRCRRCDAAIPARYPIVEGLTAALCVAVVLLKSPAVQVALGLALVLLLMPLALIDLKHRILPNSITLPGCILAIAIGLALDPAGEPTRLIAGLAAGGALLIAALAYPGGMGMGDVKLALMLGLFLGAAVIPAIAIALLLGTVVGVAIMARRGVAAGRKTAVPFGPFLAAGAAIAIFAGQPLIHLYTTNFLH